MATLTAYFDEAGTDSSKPAVAVGCYVATTEQWKRFKLDWIWLKEWQGIKTHFHRTDQESFWLHEDTKGWDRERQKTVYQAQHALIHAHTLRGFAATVIKADYDTVIKGADRRALGNAYEFCLRFCLAAIAGFLDHHPHDTIKYIIESGADGQTHLRHAFQLFLADSKVKEAHRLTDENTWAFWGKEKALPLQAADALAYEVAKEMENQFGPVKRPTRKSFLDLFRGENLDDITWWPREGLIRASRLVHSDRNWPFKDVT